MIKLEYILKRNRSNIQNFCAKNRLTSYSLLLEYCEQRNFIPCTEEDYNNATRDVSKDEEKLEREVSKPQKKRKTRSRSKSK